MRISTLSTAAAALQDPAAALDRQIRAYQSLASEWRAAGPGARAALAPALNDSPFARRAQGALNSFTRAAWAGPDAVPPQPQAQALKAFDALSEPDRKIVAALQADATPDDYRARLQADLEEARAGARRPDRITLSPEARAGTEPPPPPAPPARPAAQHPAVAAALAAYAKAAG